METLKKALEKRKIECRVETPDTVYCGSPKSFVTGNIGKGVAAGSDQ